MAAEAILCNLAARILEELGVLVVKETKLLWGVKDELKKLKTTVSIIRSVLRDAEEQYSHNHQVKVWVESLKEPFYDAEDLLDKVSTKILKKRVKSGNKMLKEVRQFFSRSNQFAFAHKIAHKIKNIRYQLDGIAANRKFNLYICQEKMNNVVAEERPQTHSSLPEVVIGREDDKRAIIKFLLFSNYGKNVSIISVAGIRGLGKTTLTQIVYNDELVKSFFELKIWVSVFDNFNVRLIVEKILESIVGEKPRDLEMNTLIRRLHEKINGKKYLLVLDDVWNRKAKEWVDLMDLLVGGSQGSKIIVTTCVTDVARVINSDSIYELQRLSNNESWSLFKKMAFKQGQVSSQEHERVGKQIVAKCVGVPLAIRVVGCLLLHKNELFEWNSIKHGELLSVNGENNSILSTLRLSYNHLPSYLKHCFASCRLIPKGSTIVVDGLIHFWMAQGHIETTSNSRSQQYLEELGFEYFEDLLSRSFFEEVEKDSWGNIVTCKMSDLMHDFASYVAGKESTVLDSNKECVEEGIRHLSIGFDVDSLWQVPPNARKVRTFMLFNRFKQGKCHVKFAKLRRLRALCLPDSGIDRVPNSIGKMKLLRYLNLSDNENIEMLPDSITNLVNLQVLNLRRCRRLKQLPQEMKMLVNLRHLYIDGCLSLNHMPRRIGRLTSLQKLSTFVVGNSKHSGGLDELHDLNHLREQLQILNLQYVKNAAKEFEAANFGGKQRLRSLLLAWKFNYDDNDNDYHYYYNYEISLETLRPHFNLKALFVYGSGRVKFPSWISSLTNLVLLRVDNCKNCQTFPALDQFPSLKQLIINKLCDLEYIAIGMNWASTSFFPSLEYLWLLNCPILRGWWRPELLQFQCLVHLEIKSCPMLSSMPLTPAYTTLVRDT